MLLILSSEIKITEEHFISSYQTIDDDNLEDYDGVTEDAENKIKVDCK